MVSLDHVAHRILSYIPYVLVLIDLRYEGKDPLRLTFSPEKLLNDAYRQHNVILYEVWTVVRRDAFKSKQRHLSHMTDNIRWQGRQSTVG